MTVTGHDLLTVTELVEKINDDSEGTPLHRVTAVEDVERVEQGVNVTLSVSIPSRSKGLQSDDEHDQWTDLRERGD